MPCDSVSRNILWRFGAIWEVKGMCGPLKGCGPICLGPGLRGRAPEVSFLAAAALLHGIQGAHAPVLLEPHPVGEEVLARSLRGGGQQGTHHHCGSGRGRVSASSPAPSPSQACPIPSRPLTCGCSQGQGLDHLPHCLDATISYDWHPKAPGILSHLVHGSALRPATGHHCGRGRQTEMSTAAERPETGPFSCALPPRRKRDGP